MSDPILDAHREDPHHYVISGPAPISIRDQVLRGVMLVERLLEADEITTERPLLVVGAGAGGASAAIQAAAHGISTTLVERNNTGFLTQRFVATRVIDPTQYDWPVDHCYIGRLPWAAHHAPLPLSFAAARADQLAIRWQYELRAATAAFPSLTVRFSTTVSNVVLGPGDLLNVTLASGDSIDVGAIVNAKGFGNEQCRIENPRGTLHYEGQPFWGPDSFTALDPRKHEVLISGAGDGALQDYFRIVTGLGRAIDIVRQCNIPSSVLQAIQSAEDRSHRGRSWAINQPAHLRQKHEGPYFWELEQFHQAMVTQLLTYPLVRSGLQRLPLRAIPVTIVYPEPYLPSYYGLNRFLALLLSAHTANTTLCPGWTIESVQESPPNSHMCTVQMGTQWHANGTYVSGVLVNHECFEKFHEVRFKSVQPPLSPAPVKTKYNVIIVRHGLQSRPSQRLQRPRHLPPYHLP